MNRNGLKMAVYAASLMASWISLSNSSVCQDLADDQIKIASSATDSQAKEARDFFRKYGTDRYFGHSNYQPKILHLKNPKLNDRSIVPLQFLVGLEELYLAGISISDDGLKNLSGLRDLKSLTLSGTVRSGSASETPEVTMKLNGKGLKFVSQLPRLEKLWLHRLTVEAKHLSTLANATNLREIWMSFVTGDGGLKDLDSKLLALRNVPNLELLRVTARLHTDQQLGSKWKPLHTLSKPLFENWKSAHSLKQLVFSGVDLDSKVWASLKTMRALERIEIRIPASEIDWETLSKLPNLKEVCLAGAKDDALVGIEKCSQIEKLNLEFSITDKGLKHLTGMQKLQSLALWHCSLNGRSIMNFGRMKSLKSLRLTGSQLDDQGLQNLSRLPALQSLDLEGTRVTPKGLNILTDFKSLKEVVPPIPWDYSGTGRSDAETLKVIEEIRKKAPHLKFKMMLDVPA